MADDKKVITDVVTDDDKDEDIDDSDESKINTADYIKKLKAEAKSYRLGKAILKKEYEDTKAKLDALEAGKLTEAEKDKNKITELEKKLVDIQTEYKEKEIDNLILQSISGKNIVDIETAMLLIKKELADEVDIDSKVVDKVIDSVIKAKPFLISESGVIPGKGNFPKKEGEFAKTTDEMFGDLIHKR